MTPFSPAKKTAPNKAGKIQAPVTPQSKAPTTTAPA